MTTLIPPAIADIASQAEAEAGTATDKFMTPERSKQAFAALSVFESKLLHIQNQQVNGVSGDGSATSWTKLTLNTVEDNEITDASLIGSVITLPAGDYIFECGQMLSPGSTSAFDVRTRLQDTTNTVTLAESINSYSAANVARNVIMFKKFTLSGTTDIELQGITDSVGMTWGNPGSLGSIEIYSDIKIWKAG